MKGLLALPGALMEQHSIAPETFTATGASWPWPAQVSCFPIDKIKYELNGPLIVLQIGKDKAIVGGKPVKHCRSRSSA